MHSPFRTLSLALIPLAFASAAHAQQTLTLADAVRLAEHESEDVRIARAGAERARGQYQQARSQLFPQITGSASYQRAIQLQFQEIAKRVGGGGSDTGSSSSNSFADSPLARVFASANTMILGISGSQMVYSGGRVRANIAATEAGRRAADLGTRAARAQNIYDVAQAYFDAEVADRLLEIADSSFAQAERAVRQTQQGRDVGNVAEYDLIRARVQRDNARPAVIAARAQRDVAFVRLRQLLNLPDNQALALATSLDTLPASSAAELRAVSDLVAATPDTSAASRLPVKQAEEGVRAQEQLLRATRGERLPQIAVTSNYQRFSYPSGVFEDRIKMYFPNWTVSLGVSMPFYTGGRLEGERVVASANLTEAKERYTQAKEAATLDTRLTLAQLERAEATYAASAGTDEQASRAYAIAEVRFNEGLATQLELSQARVDLGTARANRIEAARDLALARLRMALIHDLPLGAATATAGSR
ncbi:MAG TPA: TolC family protein [Gemmatimonadaceae bacterium]|nr:TolC family protein [Gemmatimonadaceae bacterium]